jgi:hypothetical protein
MRDNKTEIAIRFSVQPQAHGATNLIEDWEVHYNDGGDWQVESPTTIECLPKPAEILDVQTVTLVKVKQNPCYLAICIAGKTVCIRVPC